MIKAKKGLLLSVFSLILALVITTSSTYAWFAMNSTVTANNMKIVARVDSSYLVIERTASGTGSFSGKIGNINDSTLDLGVTAGENPTAVAPTAVLPVTYKNTGSDQDPNWVWQVAAGTDYNNGTVSSAGYTPVNEANVISDHYAGYYTFVVGLNPNVSAFDATNLKISSISLADAGTSRLFPALSVMVRATVGNNRVEDVYLGSDSTRRASFTPTDTILASTINHDGTPIQIEVFIFINGDNSVVKTANTEAADLTNFTVSVTFACTPPHQNVVTPANPENP